MMYMSGNEICYEYNHSAKKREKVNTLSDLNMCSVSKIIGVLALYGTCMTGLKLKESDTEDVFCLLDILDEDIAKMEREYEQMAEQVLPEIHERIQSGDMAVKKQAEYDFIKLKRAMSAKTKEIDRKTALYKNLMSSLKSLSACKVTT